MAALAVRVLQRVKGHQVFLLDAAGAALSLLCLLLFYFYPSLLGMPREAMLMLIVFATALFLFSSILFFVRPAQWKKFLIVLALANACYCLFTAYQLTQHRAVLTIPGYLYFIGEIAVILALLIFEFNRARQPH